MLTLARQHYSVLFMRQQQRDEKANTGATQQVQSVAGKVFWPDAHKCAAEGVSGADGVSVQRTRCTEDLSELRLQLAWLSARSAGPRLSVGLVTSIWQGLVSMSLCGNAGSLQMRTMARAAQARKAGCA